MTDCEPALVTGHVLDCLGRIGAGTVQTVVTSSPYWRARKYDTEPQVWGGDVACGHRWGRGSVAASGAGGDRGVPENWKTNGRAATPKVLDLGRACLDCGAWIGELGQEPTPQMFVEHLVLVLRGIRRVLRDDGTVWWNLGDTYSTHPAGLKGSKRWKQSMFRETRDHTGDEQSGEMDKRTREIPEKNLCLVPERFAIAAQEDGWYVRARIVWAKPNGMREAVKDRPARATEYIFMLAKEGRYFYDEAAVRQPFSDATIREIGVAYRGEGQKLYKRAGVQNPSDTKRRIIDRLAERGGSNLPDFWWFSPASYKGEHFATFPETLPEMCITAGSRPGDTVLDPFSGSGTTCCVARRLGRRSIGIDLNPSYTAMAAARCAAAEAPG